MLNIAEIKVIRAVFDSFHRSSGHFVDFDRRVEVHTLVVELELKWGLEIAPVGFIAIKLDLLIIRIFHVAENGGQVTFWRLIAFIG
ncbi:hypothetical protein SDC9_168030 [bioreactor metagenome]|uniref:Uncharacterized protein n=1 Tax=bioreactor metagenome TaxID=1076179 RepID=A0A645G1F5_9ZZZZ